MRREVDGSIRQATRTVDEKLQTNQTNREQQYGDSLSAHAPRRRDARKR